jgi:hypothetical protein
MHGCCREWFSAFARASARFNITGNAAFVLVPADLEHLDPVHLVQLQQSEIQHHEYTRRQTAREEHVDGCVVVRCSCARVPMLREGRTFRRSARGIVCSIYVHLSSIFFFFAYYSSSAFCAMLKAPSNV